MMFTIKEISRHRIENNWYEDTHICTCDYVKVRSGYSETSVTGLMSCGAIAYQGNATNECLKADSEMESGEVQVTAIIIENERGKTTQVVKPPRVFDLPSEK
jgi:hypothetical protein